MKPSLFIKSVILGIFLINFIIPTSLLAASLPNGAKKLVGKKIFKAKDNDGKNFWCGKIGKQFIPGKKVSGYFYSHQAEIKNLKVSLKKTKNKKQKKIIKKQITNLQNLIAKRKATCLIDYNVPNFIGYSVEKYMHKDNQNLKNLNIMQEPFISDAVKENLCTEMYSNVGVPIVVNLTLINKKRDAIADILLDDSDYGKNQVYSSFSQINKIWSIETIYDSEMDAFITYVKIILPKTVSTSTRTIKVKDIGYIRNNNTHGDCALLTDTIVVTTTDVPIQSYSGFFRLTRNETGYTVAGLNYNYDIPSLLYVPEEYQGLPINKIGDGAFEQSTMETLILSKNIVNIGINMCGMSASCYNLRKIYVLPRRVPYLGSFALRERTLIYVPNKNTYFEDCTDDFCDEPDTDYRVSVCEDKTGDWLWVRCHRYHTIDDIESNLYKKLTGYDYPNG